MATGIQGLRDGHTLGNAPNLSSREDLVWLAGWMEGEGTFNIQNKYTIRTVGCSTDEDVAKKVHSITGGSIRLSPRIGTHKDVWVISQTRGKYAYALMAALYPFMGFRRRAKIEECMVHWSSPT